MASKYVYLEGYNRVQRFLSLGRKNIKEGYDRGTQQEMYDLKDLMTQKILNFNSSGELLNSLTIGQEFVTDKQVGWALFTNAVHAAPNEFGIQERPIITEGKPSLQAWCQKELGTVPRKLVIGTSSGRIPYGASRNKFFFNSVEEYRNSNLSRVIGREVQKAINKLK